MSDYFDRLRAQAVKEERERIVLRVIKRDRYSFEEIADLADIPLHRVKALAKTVEGFSTLPLSSSLCGVGGHED